MLPAQCNGTRTQVHTHAQLLRMYDSDELPNFQAATDGDIKLITQMLERDIVDVDIEDDDGWTALHCAAKAGSPLSLCVSIYLSRVCVCMYRYVILLKFSFK